MNFLKNVISYTFTTLSWDHFYIWIKQKTSFQVLNTLLIDMQMKLLESKSKLVSCFCIKGVKKSDTEHSDLTKVVRQWGSE